MFPGAEFETKGEIVHLTEPANILEIIFQYMHPMKQPRLQERDTTTVIAVAEAVQKYQIFAAMQLCEYRLKSEELIYSQHYSELIIAPRELVEQDAQAVLVHVLKHYESYDASLINSAAVASSRLPQSLIIRRLIVTNVDGRFISAWVSPQ